MKKRSSLSLAASCLLLVPLLAPANPGAQPLDGYAAVVNQRVVTIGDIMEILGPAEQQLRAAYSGEELARRLEDAYRSALNTLVERQLILEEFVAQKLMVPEAMIDDHIRELVFDRFNNDRAALMQALDREKLSYQQWRSQIHDRIAVMMLRRREVGARLQVSPTAVREEYERRIEEFTRPAEVQLRTIALNKGTTEEEAKVKRAEAESIQAKLEAGEDFGELARKHSQGAYAAQGGSWGWITPGSLRAELAAAVEDAEVGKVSPLVETPEEIYLLLVEASKAARVVPFEEVKDQLDREVQAREEARLYQDWMERLKRNHFVKIYR